jgi:DUF1680 family protein
VRIQIKIAVRKSAVCAIVFALWMTNTFSQEKLYPNQFPLQDVQLLNGPLQRARDLNIKVLLQYDTDRLLEGFRKVAGLPSKAKLYTNWEGLEGHIGGHYLTALAINYSATGNPECGKRLSYMIDELQKCQEANARNNPAWGIGYIGAVPNSKNIWDGFRKGDFTAFRAAWVPWYNVHKMYAGLRDAWLYTGNKKAKELFLSFCDWGINISSALTDAQMQSILDTEHGGMNEIFADAYQITGEKKYLEAAKRFSHRMLLDAMAASIDNLDNKHANTQVPKAVGFERIGEVSDDATYKKAGHFFWQTVTTKRSLALGGNSRREFFPAAASSIDFVNDVEGPESCNSYNMLKLTGNLFRVSPSAALIDYYERTVFNHILSTQHPENGGYVYFTPARPRSYRVYSAPNEAMWCCVGSGMENHGKYNELIYSHTKDSLFLNLFIPSILNWRDKGIKIKQQTNFPFDEQTTLTITEGAAHFSLLVRYPSWVAEKALQIRVNGKNIDYTTLPSSYISINRRWRKGDIITVQLPMHASIEQLPNVPNYVAFMYGPILLGAKTGAEDLKGLIADDGRWSHIPGGAKLPLQNAPIILENKLTNLPNSLVPVSNKPLHFTIPQLKIINPIQIELEPFFQIHDTRYMMYWMVLNNNQYQKYIDSVSILENAKLELQKRTIDFVAPGEQQPEADHSIQKNNSTTGNYLDEFWRDARNDGYFSYALSTNGEQNLNLIVRYWGNERGNRKFDIYIDDEKLVSENIVDKWKEQKFKDVEYEIPESMISNKKTIRVKFKAQTGGTAGSVYYIRLAKRK